MQVSTACHFCFDRDPFGSDTLAWEAMPACAPEVLMNGERHSPATNAWSFGVILWEVRGTGGGGGGGLRMGSRCLKLAVHSMCPQQHQPDDLAGPLARERIAVDALLPLLVPRLSLQMLTGTLASNKICFSQMMRTMLAKRDMLPPLPASCPRELQALVSACLGPDPVARPSFPAILAQLEALQAGLVAAQ